MPRFPAGVTRDGWQIVKREDGWWLQMRQPSGLWADYSGPYRGRHSALERYRRMEFYEIMALRQSPEHIHRFAPDPNYRNLPTERQCVDCALWIPRTHSD